MYKQDLELNNIQWLIYHKTKPNKTALFRSHNIQLYHSSLQPGLRVYDLYPHRAVLNKFLLVGQRSVVHM